MKLERTGRRLTGVRKRPLLQKIGFVPPNAFSGGPSNRRTRVMKLTRRLQKQAGADPSPPRRQLTDNPSGAPLQLHQRIFRTLLAGGAVNRRSILEAPIAELARSLEGVCDGP